MATTPLVSIRQLILDSWNHYTTHWKRMMEVSLWLLLFPLIYLLISLALSGFAPRTTVVILQILTLLDGLFAVWVWIRLIRLALAKNPKEERSVVMNLRSGWDVFLPYIVISIANSMAVLGGMAIFFFPGIWLAVRFSFSSFAFLDTGERHIHALAASSDLVKGRWWATFWRIVVPGVVFFLLAACVVWAIHFLVGLFVGFEAINRLMYTTYMGNIQPQTIQEIQLQSIGQFLNRIPQALFIPIFVIFLSKLYRSLKETR